jgi:hypothetical protein
MVGASWWVAACISAVLRHGEWQGSPGKAKGRSSIGGQGALSHKPLARKRQERQGSHRRVAGGVVRWGNLASLFAGGRRGSGKRKPVRDLPRTRCANGTATQKAALVGYE